MAVHAWDQLIRRGQSAGSLGTKVVSTLDTYMRLLLSESEDHIEKTGLDSKVAL
jgi:hypothetical protein